MAYSGGAFSLEEAAYLLSLPVVKDVSPVRITYTDEFKREAVRRYRNGESPVKIFRDAGLDPQLIGYKRIERCIARWRELPENSVELLVETADGNPSAASPSTPGVDAAIEAELEALRTGKRKTKSSNDIRDLIIMQQIRHIELASEHCDCMQQKLQQVESENKRLQALNDELQQKLQAMQQQMAEILETAGSDMLAEADYLVDHASDSHEYDSL